MIENKVKNTQFTTNLETGLKNFWRKANESISIGDLIDADEQLDYCLVMLATATNNGYEKIAGSKVDVWKNRVWICIENNGLLPD